MNQYIHRSIAGFLLILTCCLLSLAAGWNNSATTDEPCHILAGYAMVSQGYYDFNPEHPPLAKLLSGLSLLAIHPVMPSSIPGDRMSRLPLLIHEFLYQNRVSPMAILRWARFPMIFFVALLLWLTYLWAKEMYGRGVALAAVTLLGTQPLLLGQGQVVHTDVAATVFWVMSLYALHRLVQRPGPAYSSLLSLALGFSFLSKFSSIYLILIVLLLAMAISLIRHRPGIAMWSLVSTLGAIILIVAVYHLSMRNQNEDVEKLVIEQTMARFPHDHSLRTSQLLRLAEISPSLAHIALGLTCVEMTNQEGQGINYLFGQVRVKGFLLYFPSAFLLKCTFPLLLLFGIRFLRRKLTLEEGLFLVSPILIYFLVSSTSSYNIGARHLLPIVPMVAILGASLFTDRGMKSGIGVLLLLQCLIPLTAFPHYIAHVNYLAGGRWMGAHYLADSNLDWGQDWVRMSHTLSRMGIPGNRVTTVYIGTGFPAAHIHGSMNFFDEPARWRPYVVLSKQVEQTGESLLLFQGRIQESRALTGFLNQLHREGEVMVSTGSTLTLYRRKE
ncbi:MAG TPA: glycosyltransferase family 39 protein [Thermoanaerobaculia bacterium]|nr:glycosyltransferase family 39 protein [Thermoanaerobaculia bacterium]HUM30443.1 glycosyltransferase family 39 protein [Thermoanaerobaculia bacterium]HXK68690.1 glycosyltransferase family 39 protein [Thermoanaerobaculia bacterium]